MTWLYGSVVLDEGLASGNSLGIDIKVILAFHLRIFVRDGIT